jgi:inward rectifier potassium channel
MTPMDERPADEYKDLGLGARVAQQSRLRFLNRDGSFNVARRGLSFIRSQNAYHLLLTISWTNFFLLLILGYFLANALFALLYMLCGPGALRGAVGETFGERFLEAFVFSVQTLATIGYGGISPNGLAANLLVTVEALTGLLGFALATGLLFARFSRPAAKIMFSRHAVIAPYRDLTAFEFRIANVRSSELIDVRATVVLSRSELVNGAPVRRFHPLTLERSGVMFFPLHWVVVHPIDPTSPLNGVTREALEASDAEFLILLTAIDETFSQTVHARTSYKHHEVIWGASFSDMFITAGGSTVGIDLRRIHDTQSAPLSVIR